MRSWVILLRENVRCYIYHDRKSVIELNCTIQIKRDLRCRSTRDDRLRKILFDKAVFIMLWVVSGSWYAWNNGLWICAWFHFKLTVVMIFLNSRNSKLQTFWRSRRHLRKVLSVCMNSAITSCRLMSWGDKELWNKKISYITFIFGSIFQFCFD